MLRQAQHDEKLPVTLSLSKGGQHLHAEPPWPQGARSGDAKNHRMKMLLQILVAIVLHPLALVLMIINLLGREDLDGGKKLIWGIVGILWGIGPILYITVGEGALW
jgi:hypothetical protein